MSVSNVVEFEASGEMLQHDLELKDDQTMDPKYAQSLAQRLDDLATEDTLVHLQSLKSFSDCFVCMEEVVGSSKLACGHTLCGPCLHAFCQVIEDKGTKVLYKLPKCWCGVLMSPRIAGSACPEYGRCVKQLGPPSKLAQLHKEAIVGLCTCCGRWGALETRRAGCGAADEEEDGDDMFWLSACEGCRQKQALFRSLEQAKGECKSKDPLELACHHIVDNILSLRCPRCRAVFVDFSGCFSVYCNACPCSFCAWCLEDCGNDAHDHVFMCNESLEPQSYFGNKQSFELVHRKRREREVREFLDAAPPFLRASIVARCQTDFTDLGLDISL